MLNHYKTNIPIMDAGISRLLKNQCTDPSSPLYGTIADFYKGFSESSIGICSAYITAYYTPESAYYRDPTLLERAILAMKYQLAHQHEDGTIDLLETNFHDSTANAFSMQKLGPAYKLLKHFTKHTELEDELEELLYQFTKTSGDAMVNCGFHTPNHRWVVSSALSLCYNLIGDPKYLEHIHKFLNEGIDCDENGEYTERSAGIYNIVCNRSLIFIAEELNMPELYDHVTRNLYMVMKYIEPDETICTMNSARQDAGTDPSWDVYYENYLYMAIKTQNPEFAWMADQMQKQNLGRWASNPDTAIEYTGYFYKFLLEPEFVEQMLNTPVKKPDFTYEKHFEESGIVRKRTGDYSLTLVKDRPIFAKFQYKNHYMLFRFAGSFFGTLGQFRAQEIIPLEDGYRLHYHAKQGYIRPFEEKPPTWKWREMDHSKRKTVCVQHFDVNIDFRFKDNTLTINISTEGCENVPVKLEMLIPPGGIYSTADTEFFSKAGDYVFLKQGCCEYTFKDFSKFRIKGGFNAHHYGSNMRGSIGANPDLFTIVLTGFTPIEKQVSITAE
ncbi:MAG TPA: hypothetical protein GXX37_15270 [Clostridiaceae bacterium]|nr:hypothetical protein [Clostridiaceae bacterium]